MRKLLILMLLPGIASAQVYKTVATVKEGENIDSVIAHYCRCGDYKMPRESHVRFGHLLADGKWNIRSGEKDFGVFEKILFMRETEDRFAAVVATGGVNYFVDMEGKRVLPAGGRVTALVTNGDLSRAAVVLADGAAMPMGGQLSREEQVAFFDKLRLTDTLRRVWVKDGGMAMARKNSRLSFDMTGRHLLDIRPKVFFIDGVENRRDVSGGGTQLFVNRSGSNWAYFYMIYLTFKDNFTIRDARHPFVTTEEGKEYLNWFIADRAGGAVVLKLGRRAL